MRLAGCKALALLVALISGSAVSEAADGWTWVHPSPNGFYLNAVATCGVRTVAVGRSGRMLTTTDGLTWDELDSGTTSTLRDITCTDTGWVAVGSAGTVVTSTDGSSWTVGSTGTSTTLYAVGWEGRYIAAGIAAGYESAVFISDDGATWQQRYTGSDLEELAGFASSGSKLVISGGELDILFGIYRPMLLISSDAGLTWTKTSFPNQEGQLDRATFGGSGFAVAARSEEAVVMSADGVSWSFVDVGMAPVGIAWTGTRYVAVGDDGMAATSTDGTSWSQANVGLEVPLADVEGDDQLLVAVGLGESMVISTDGAATWQTIAAATSAFSMNIRGLASDGSTIVAVGDDSDSGDATIATRDPSGTWTVQPGTLTALWAVAYGNGVFVAVGGSEDVIEVSSDGLVWTDVSRPTDSTLLDVIWTGIRFVAVGSDADVLISPDGSTWTVPPISGTGAPLLDAVSCRSSRCVAIGTSCETLVSADGGATWPERGQPNYDCIRARGIVDIGTRLVAVSHPTKVFTSADGLSWAEQVTGSASSLWDIAQIGGRLVAVGNGVAFESPDGLTWSPLDIGIGTWMITIDPDHQLVGGMSGRILRSSELFADGVESSDTGRWSVTVPSSLAGAGASR